MATPSLFLIPILCIDKLSNPHTFKVYLLFLSSSFLSYSDLWGGNSINAMKGGEEWWAKRLKHSRLKTISSFSQR